MKRAVFLDRDGVINVERAYVHRIEDFDFIAGVPQAMAALKRAGWQLVVVTNQAGIARGLYTEATLAQLHAHLHAALAPLGAAPDAIYHCPHHPEGIVPALARACDCRKPAPGMLRQAARELGLDLAASVLVGDKISDVQAGRAAGLARNYLVRSGHALADADLAQADGVFAALPELAAWLLQHGPPPNPHPASPTHPS